jgi:hypothetical protein
VSLEDIVQITITAATNTPTRPGFGTPLLAVSKVPATWGANRVRTFSKLSELTDAGFLVTDPAYLMATKLASQNPRPRKFKIGKRALVPSQTIELKCLSATEGDVYTITVGTDVITYTVPAAVTPTDVAAAIAALIDALTSAVATSAVDVITVTPQTAGALLNFKSISKLFKLTDITADPGIATDLAAIAAEDSDWYGLALDSNSQAEVVAGAAWTEAAKKLFFANTTDYGNKDPAYTYDLMYVLKAAGYKRTAVLFSGAELLSYSGLAWMSEEFPFDPGKRTWAFKSLSGVTVDTLTAGETAAIEGKNGNHYTPVAGLSVTQNGKSAQGEFIDTTRFIDWLESEMKIQVFAALANAPKIPYTDKGVGTIVATITSVLRAGVRAGGLADDDNLFVRAPKVADVDSISRGARLLPDVEFGGRLAGAIHAVKVAGTLSV